MKHIPQTLGDSHNFGRRVRVVGGSVAKPRAVLWEWLVLSAKSPLRKVLADAARQDGSPGLFLFLPSLRFHGADLHREGKVEALKLSPLGSLKRAQKQELARVTGRVVALFSWLGVSDLHWENMALGLDARGRVIFSPLDIEMMFEDMSLPTETRLIAEGEGDDREYAALCAHASGLRRVLPYLGKPVDPQHLVEMLHAYATMLAFLERHARAIAAVFLEQPALRTTPLRVCLRGTAEYVWAEQGLVFPPLLDAELEQLERGDIPYFYRLYGKRGIHYFTDASLEHSKRLPLRGDVPTLSAGLSFERGLRSKSRAHLAQEGLLALLGAFDDASLTGRHVSTDEQFEVTFSPRKLVVTRAGMLPLHSKRNLRAWVSSAYLPCRCGEVRSVFVPGVTKCEMR